MRHFSFVPYSRLERLRGKVPKRTQNRKLIIIFIMNIQSLLANNENANISVTVSVADLKEFAMFLIDEAQTAKAEEQKPEEYLTPKEVAEKLGVSTNTLWRWNNTKYLCHVKVGRKPFYRKSDVMKIMEG